MTCLSWSSSTMAISKTSPILQSSSLSNPSSPSSSDSSPSSPLPLYPVRRVSECDINYPPRYSTLLQATDRATSPSFTPPVYSNQLSQRSHSLGPADTRPYTLAPSRARSLLPLSQARNGTYKHYYHISGTKATLKVHSRSSFNLDIQNKPHFAEGDLIRGVLELNLDTPQTINSISLSLRGRITATSYEHAFLDQPITSWDRNDGDPRSMFFTSETVIKKFEGKLSGHYTWPFSLTFPKQVTIRGQHQYLSKAYPTPPSFSENETNLSVRYDLVLRITHGMLRADSKLNVEIIYVPESVPDSFSSLCRAAYRRNMSIPGLDADPEGWFTLSHANIHGKLSFNDRHAHLRCTLSLAKPLCYSRGGVIPCHLSIHSKNIEALDTLADHKYTRVCLVRRLHLHEDPKQAYSKPQQVQNPNSDQAPPGIIEKVETIERAVWWPVSSEEPDTRYLQGEIHLDKELQPSSQFLLFKVSYTIELYPFESRIFKCTNSGFNTDSVMRNPKAFMSHPVTIATQYRQGEVPVPITRLYPHPRKRIEFPPPDFSFCAP